MHIIAVNQRATGVNLPGRKPVLFSDPAVRREQPQRLASCGDRNSSEMTVPASSPAPDAVRNEYMEVSVLILLAFRGGVRMIVGNGTGFSLPDICGGIVVHEVATTCKCGKCNALSSLVAPNPLCKASHDARRPLSCWNLGEERAHALMSVKSLYDGSPQLAQRQYQPKDRVNASRYTTG
ncbi:hypothetical protein D9M70_542480 [compost metagenome]